MLATLPVPSDVSLARTSLFLDFDGTLVPIALRPDAVIVSSRTRTLLQRLAARMDGRLAVVSGRSVAQIRSLLGGLPLTIAGSHGLELAHVDGRMEAVRPPDTLAAVAEELETLAAQFPGVLVEEKPFGVAIHYREAPEAAEACEALALELEARTSLTLQPGKMVFELRARGGDKGTVVGALMRQPPMAGTIPLFMGDDLTDEAGFRAALTLGGGGILVGPMRTTEARYRLADVDAALDWLEQLLEQDA